MDTSMYGRQKTVLDYMRENEEFDLRKMLGASRMNGGAGNTPAAMQLANKYLEAQQAGDTKTMQALEMFAKTLPKGAQLDDTGGLTPRNGYFPFVGGESFNKQTGTNNANIAGAAPLKANQNFGDTYADKVKGQSDIDKIVDEMSNDYAEINKTGGITNKNADWTDNLSAATRSSTVGQGFGRMFGTKEQSYRQNIENNRNLLVQAIKNATGMSAQQMNSNMELQNMLRALSDPQSEYSSNQAILGKIKELYGTQAGIKPPLGVDNQYSPLNSMAAQPWDRNTSNQAGQYMEQMLQTAPQNPPPAPYDIPPVPAEGNPAMPKPRKRYNPATGQIEAY